MTSAVYQGLVGLPYAEDGRGPDAYNCGELCLEVYRRAEIPVPRPEYTNGTPWTAKRILVLNENQDWQPVKRPFREFDLVVMSEREHDAATHCGVFIPPNQVLHVTDIEVCCQELRVLKRKYTIVGVYRYRCRS
jgi:cell wall-associated NlpC family hydrolase